MAAVRAKPAIVFIGPHGRRQVERGPRGGGAVGEEALDADEEIEPSWESRSLRSSSAKARGRFATARSGWRWSCSSGVESSRSAAARSRVSACARRCDAASACGAGWTRNGLGALPRHRQAACSRLCGVLAALPRARAPVRGCRPGDPSRGRRDIGRLAAPWLAALRRHPEVSVAWARWRPASTWPPGAGATELLGESEVADEIEVSRWFAIADTEALRHQRELLPGGRGGDRPHRRRGAKDPRRGRAGAARAAGAGARGRRSGRVRRRRRRRPGRVLCGVVPARGSGGARPTTLVAQVDSAYGGKTGVDLPRGEELRRVPHAVGGARRPAGARHPARRGARGRLRRGAEDGPDRGRRAVGSS